MMPMLNHRHGVHRSNEDRQEDHPMVEWRAEQVGRNPEHRTEADEQLNEFLHARV